MNAAPVTDASQDVRVLGGSQNETHTIVTFARDWDTCDPHDHQLTVSWNRKMQFSSNPFGLSFLAGFPFCFLNEKDVCQKRA